MQKKIIYNYKLQFKSLFSKIILNVYDYEIQPSTVVTYT